jgi:hypothetical protein
MDGHGNHRASIVVLGAILVAGALAQPVPADESLPPLKPPPTIVVTTQPDAAVVEADASVSTPGRTPTKVASRRKCYLEPDTAPITFSNVHIYGEHIAERSFYLYCDGEYVGLVWRKIEDGSRPASPVAPGDVAMYLREEIPIPQATIRVNPETGLVGTESWFWIEGYSGEVISDSTDAFGRLVEVEASVTRYEWLFGDGAKFSSNSPGRPYPERSEVRHVYERSSAGVTTGYPIDVRFVFAVKDRVAGGPWIELPSISRSASFAYRVRESQAVISR